MSNKSLSICPNAQVSLAHAAQLLQHAVHEAGSRYLHHQSGVIRIEVRLIMSCVIGHALMGHRTYELSLAANTQAQHDTHTHMQVPAPQEASALRWLQGQTNQQMQPSFFYSPRRSPAPETPSGAAASAGALGPGAVAGVLASRRLWLILLVSCHPAVLDGTLHHQTSIQSHPVH